MSHMQAKSEDAPEKWAAALVSTAIAKIQHLEYT